MLTESVLPKVQYITGLYKLSGHKNEWKEKVTHPRSILQITNILAYIEHTFKYSIRELLNVIKIRT